MMPTPLHKDAFRQVHFGPIPSVIHATFNHKFCPICHEFELNPHVAYHGGRERMDYFSVSEVEASARTCKFCQILLSILEEVDLTRVSSLGITNDTRDGTFKGIMFCVEYSYGYTLPGGTYARYFVRNLSRLSTVDVIRTCESGVVNTGSATCVKWAQDKIRECQNGHSDCNLKTQGYLPDRVLSIGPPITQHTSDREDIVESDVKLYESSGNTSAYAALSHRWGNSQPLSLRLENMSKFRKSIPWQSFPKTFQQAAIFTRKLGLEYIWIDSLCIIQDSKEDWLEQSGKMADIYEHSFITLAATASRGAESGCFIEPLLPLRGYVTDGTIRIPANDHTEIQRLLANTSIDNPIIFVKGSSRHNTPGQYTHDDLPLLKRGWVYQERLLSPRILHFGAIDLIWECNHDMACYCGSYIPQDVHYGMSNPIKPQHVACIRADNKDGDVNLAAHWIHLIQAYSVMDLTYRSDRLPAIAGIAKQFRRGLENKNYMAGLWEESLIVGLTWSRATTDTSSYELRFSLRPLEPRPSATIAGPSWSWIMVPGPITYLSTRETWSDAGGPTIKNITFDQDGDTEFTTLRGGSITLHGKLMVCRQRVIRTLHMEKHGIAGPGKTGFPHYGILRPGQPGFFKVKRDYSPDNDELLNEWQTVIPRWVKNTPPIDQDNSSLVHQLPANEDLDDEIILQLSGAKYISVQQSRKLSYGLYMGRRFTSGSNLGTAVFMLLDRSDGLERVYTRIGLGEYPDKLSLFENIEETQDVVII